MEIELVDDVVLDLALHRLAIREEAAPDPIGDLPEPQVKAGWLHVGDGNFEAAGINDTGLHGLQEVLSGKYPLTIGRERERQSGLLSLRPGSRRGSSPGWPPGRGCLRWP